VDALQPKVKKFSGARSLVIQEPTLQTGQRGGGGLPVAFVVQAPNFEKLKKMMEGVGFKDILFMDLKVF
jgi:multidrug efflux pump